MISMHCVSTLQILWRALLIYAAVPVLSETGISKDNGTACLHTRGSVLLQLDQQVAYVATDIANRQVKSIAGICNDGAHCVVPAGEDFVLDSSLEVETLTIWGQLRWATHIGGLELRAGYVLVEDGGHLEIGSKAVPMNLPATVHITKNSNEHADLGKRFLGGRGSAKIDIHGRQLAQTWTLLSQTTLPGSRELQLKHDPIAMGWQRADRIGIATTSRGDSTIHTISDVHPFSITLSEPVQFEHWGGLRHIYGRHFEMAAEVVNLERTVVITGDHHDIDSSLEGLHTIMTGTGYMDMRYARVEYCGQRPVLGRYCLHFHHMGQCPKCVFQGNAAMSSQHVGITLHGTHKSLVDQNIVWDARGPGIYTEDGNEMDNTIRRNVVICSAEDLCKVDWAGGSDSQLAGIFLIGMTNNIIENHVVGHENGMWSPGIMRSSGAGMAKGRVCPANAPFGEFRGNVWHDNHRFGLYVDNQHPRNLKRDSNGFLLDESSCDPFTASGADNGVVNEIRDDFNWHNVFVGGYAWGDLQLINYTSVNNAHAMYWKTSKNFADGRLWHVLDSTFINDPSDSYGSLRFLGPSAPFTFGMKNCVFAGDRIGSDGMIAAGQNCKRGGAGGPCNVQYLLENVDWSQVDIEEGKSLIGFGANGRDEAYVLPVFVAKDETLGGFRSIASGYLNGFGVAGCEKLSSRWANGFGCNQLVRRFNLWGRDSGVLTLSGPGYAVAASSNSPTDGRNAGQMQWDDSHGGYGTPVFVNRQYTLSGSIPGDMIIEFSDTALAEYFGSDESMQLKMASDSCVLKSSDDRRYLISHGNGLQGVNSFTTEGHSSIQGGRLVCSTFAPTTTVLPPGAPITSTSSPSSSSFPVSSSGPATAPPQVGDVCESSLVQRRRRNREMCSCRRRSGTEDLASGWACVDDVIQGPALTTDPPASSSTSLGTTTQSASSSTVTSSLSSSMPISTTAAVPTESIASFQDADGGMNRACRGSSTADNSNSYFLLLNSIATIEDCKAECVARSTSCKGIEYHSRGRCEVWTRDEGIQATAAVSGYICLRYRHSASSTSRRLTTSFTTSISATLSNSAATGTATTSWSGATVCEPSQVQRRRRNSEMCSCRRRSNTEDLASGWACVNDAIVFGESPND